MIKNIIFDLDGVLVDTKNLHYECLNMSLQEIDAKFVISHKEHFSKFDGLNTTKKLKILNEERGLPLELFEIIWDRKQELTFKFLEKIEFSEPLYKTIESLFNDGYSLSCCSNSIRKTVDIVLKKLKIFEFFNCILSNEDVVNPKPHPEIYWKSIYKNKFLPEETLIIEDSPIGLLSAFRSGGFVLRVNNPQDLSYEIITQEINKLNKFDMKKPKWVDKKMNVVIPMAGAGSRFKEHGYELPKPLIDVNGKPMIEVVIESLNLDAMYIFIVQKEHREKYNLDNILKNILSNFEIIEVDTITEGAACTVLKSENLINNENPLMIVNSDQYIEWDSETFYYKMNENDIDGSILTFNSTHPKWSFVKLDSDGYICQVAEKNPISNIATVGIYYWKKGSDFVHFANDMIQKNIRVNNEFYICPVFNQAIENYKKVTSFDVKSMWGLGTPEDLEYFLKNKKK